MTDVRIQKVLEQSDLPPAALVDLGAAIDSSPYLQRALLTAIDHNKVGRFSLSRSEHEGGHYDADRASIGINPDAFHVVLTRDRLDVIAGLTGHETGHALMAESASLTTYRYSFEVDQLVRDATQNGEASIDITPIASHMINDFRKNEALAELVLMNSVASRIAHPGKAFKLDDFLMRADAGTECIDDGKLHFGIRLGPDGIQRTGGRINGSPVEQVAACHFDDGAKTLGLKGTSSYSDYYAAYALGAAVDAWKDYGRGSTQVMPVIEVDLAALTTSKQGVEDAGTDLGGKGGAFDFIYTSHGRRQMVSIRQLGDGAKKQPDIHAALGKPVLADDPAHPDNASFQRIQQWVSGTGQWDDEQSRNVAAALYRQRQQIPCSRASTR